MVDPEVRMNIEMMFGGKDKAMELLTSNIAIDKIDSGALYDYYIENKDKIE